ncbi:hypothetical protein MA16_Dca017350 [Dendrobium catenatum]|uniref:Uncharacterized protein n=1 Tax=Dendrobium catenatum TaxID=906689 RepID=A0A2I0WC63_9ASPA|nr:hypothetical protein MA16_Dca017350 [Dendrobium catenatum]
MKAFEANKQASSSKRKNTKQKFCFYSAFGNRVTSHTVIPSKELCRAAPA